MVASVFSTDVLRRLARLQVVARKQLGGFRRGNRDVYRRGGSVEFADHRQYMPGDDLRYLDWNIYVRLGQLFTKQYEAEDDIELLLFVDRSRSMEAHPGPRPPERPSKLLQAQLLAGALGYIALANLDAVRVLPFDGAGMRPRPVIRGKALVRSLLTEIEGLEVGEEVTDLLGAVEAGLPPGRGRGPAVLLSDCFAPEHAMDRALGLLRARAWQPHVIHLVDAAERSPPLQGRVRLVDAERGSSREVVITPQLLSRYRAFLERRTQRLRALCMRHEAGYARVPTDVPFEDVVLELLRRRGLVG
jgi:uncharacterized protein (DUF58 family)